MTTSRGRSSFIGQATALFLSIAALSSACTDDRGTTGPRLPDNPPTNPAIKSAAFVADVNLRTAQVKIAPPEVKVTRAPGMLPDGPGRSILAGDAVELTASNFFASAVGQFTPGKIRVTFDINVTNRLSSVELITPTFPTPPAGAVGVILFPYENVVTVTNGGVSTGGDGTDIIVELPSYGLIEPSITWDGAPHNFFNDAGCPAGANDCYRYETFSQPLAAGGTSEAHTVGFDMDPTVGSFRARLILTADLRNAGAAPTGTVSGSVTSPQRGALAGVVVTANSGGFTGTTSGTGAYSIANVTTGPKTISLSSLPAGCTDPGSQTTTVTSGGTSTVNFVVQCSVPAGTISGTISSSLGGGLSAVSVTATPSGGSPVGPVSTSGTGAYSLPNVPVAGGGTGSLALANLPAGCTNPGPVAYNGLTSGGTITVNVTVACTPPPAGYAYTAVWGPISGGQVTLTLRIDMSTFNDPAVNGANPDDIEAIQGVLSFSPTRLQFVSAANVAGSGLQNVTASVSSPGVIQWLNITTNPGVATQQGLQGLAVLTFNVLAGAATTVTTGNTFDVAQSRDEVNLIPRIIVTEGVLSIP